MNRALHAVCNRGKGFCSPVFPVLSSFTPSVELEDEKAVRHFLGLDRTDTDYWTVLFMRLLQTSPDLMLSLSESQKTYDLKSYWPDSYTVSGADLISYRGRGPLVARQATEWPAVEEIKITVLSLTSVLIELGTLNWTVPAKQISTDLLVFDWPSETGVCGVLRAHNFWAVTDQVTIHHKPITVDFESVRQAALSTPQCMSVLGRSGHTAAFIEARSARRAIAVLVFALASLHPTLHV